MVLCPLRRIGILGGMGPQATVHFISRIIATTPAEDDADHVPMLIDNNPQVPSRIKALLEGGTENPGPVLVQMARHLEACGAQALAMPCNTAHHYADDIRAAISIPFIDMIELCTEQIAATTQPGAKVGMLASPAARITGLFDKVLAKHERATFYLADDAPLLALIRHIKMHGADAKAFKDMADLSNKLQLQGADILLISCTELSLVASAAPAHITLDTLDVLASACVAFSTNSKERAA